MAVNPNDGTPVGPMPPNIQVGEKDPTSIQLAKDMRTKRYGKDVRETMARMIEWTAVLNKFLTKFYENTDAQNKEYYRQTTNALSEFSDLKPKAELSISRSVEALTRSRNALNVANGIDAKATNALNLSKSSDILSKSVQEQFNQVVIEGDSSVEAAQARVDASGQTNPTLKARLDKEYNEVTTQLAQTENQLKFMKDSGHGINTGLAWGLLEGLDMTQIIQDKVNATPDGETLYFPKGIFVFSGINFIEKKNIRLIGNFTQIKNSDPQKNIINLYNCENITIENFDTLGDWSTMNNQNLGQFIYSENTKGLTITNNRINGHGLSINFGEKVRILNNDIIDENKKNNYPIALRNVDGSSIIGNFINGALIDGIKITMPLNAENLSRQTIIAFNQIKNCVDDCIDLFAGGLNAIVESNILTDSRRGVNAKMWGTGDDYSTIEGHAKEILIQGNQILRMAHSAVVVGSDEVNVEGNIINGAACAIEIGIIDKVVKNSKILSNKISNISGHAIESMVDTYDVYLSDNIIDNVGIYGMLLRSNGITIIGGVIKDVGLRGIQASGTPRKENRLIINGVQVLKDQKNVTEIGIAIGDNIKADSLVSNCYIDETIAMPIFDNQARSKQFANSWN